jgi:hypothetical protein
VESRIEVLRRALAISLSGEAKQFCETRVIKLLRSSPAAALLLKLALLAAILFNRSFVFGGRA